MRERTSVWLLLFGVWSLLMMLISVQTGVLHDYYAYTRQWLSIGIGNNPWRQEAVPTNAYGPLHVALTPVYKISELAPKFLFASVLIVVLFLFLRTLLSRNYLSRMTLAFWTILVFLNFFLIGIAFVFGLNDSLVAALLGLAVLARWRKATVVAGLAIGAAALLKFYPLLLLPALALDGRKINMRLMSSASIAFIGGFAISLVVWGESALDPLLFGGSRSESGFLSLMFYLHQMRLNGVPAFGTLADLYEVGNILIVGVALVAIFGIGWWKRLDWLHLTSISMLAIFILGKVSHQQILLPWIILLVAILARGVGIDQKFVMAGLPVVIFLSLYQIYFDYLIRTNLYWEGGGSLLKTMAYPFATMGLFTLVVQLGLAIRGVDRKQGVQGETMKAETQNRNR